jgi:hypothetical protein
MCTAISIAAVPVHPDTSIHLATNVYMYYITIYLPLTYQVNVVAGLQGVEQLYTEWAV